MSKWVVDIHGEIEGDYDLIEKYTEPQIGHWITKIKSDLRGDMWPTNPKCSECGGEPYYSNTIYNYKFCPYCGAKMVEPQESDHTCHTCHTCKHYTSGEHDGSCGSYICKGYSDWESEDKE